MNVDALSLLLVCCFIVKRKHSSWFDCHIHFEVHFWKPLILKNITNILDKMFQLTHQTLCRFLIFMLTTKKEGSCIKTEHCCVQLNNNVLQDWDLSTVGKSQISVKCSKNFCVNNDSEHRQDVQDCLTTGVVTLCKRWDGFCLSE